MTPAPLPESAPRNPVAVVPLWAIAIIAPIFIALVLWGAGVLIGVRDSTLTLNAKVERLERNDARNEELARQVAVMVSKMEAVDKRVSDVGTQISNLSDYIMNNKPTRKGN